MCVLRILVYARANLYAISKLGLNFSVKQRAQAALE